MQRIQLGLGLLNADRNLVQDLVDQRPLGTPAQVVAGVLEHLVNDESRRQLVPSPPAPFQSMIFVVRRKGPDGAPLLHGEKVAILAR